MIGLGALVVSLMVGLQSLDTVSTTQISGWTETDALETLEAEGLRDVRVTTFDPRFPDTQGYTADGFPISLVRMACRRAEPARADPCRGIWITAVLPSTEERWATKIIDSLERNGNGPPGVHAHTGRIVTEDGQQQPTVILSSYLAADGGVSSQLLPYQLRYFLGIVGQTRTFMLSDDPQHAELWAPEP
jgi:hypothetical protein